MLVVSVLSTESDQDPVYLHRKDRNDTATEPGFDYEAWKAKHTAFANEATPGWVKEVKAKYGKPNTKFACVGYTLHPDVSLAGSSLVQVLLRSPVCVQ